MKLPYIIEKEKFALLWSSTFPFTVKVSKFYCAGHFQCYLFTSCPFVSGQQLGSDGKVISEGSGKLTCPEIEHDHEPSKLEVKVNSDSFHEV